MTYGSVQRAKKVSNCIHTKFKSVMNLKKFIKRKGCVTVDGSIAISRPTTPRLLSVGLSEVSCLLKSSSDY
jgi:riboflavin synthase alpha subunit